MGYWKQIEHNGVQTTFLEISKTCDVSCDTLRDRYRKGWRGERLTRPVIRKPPGFIRFCEHCEKEFHHHFRKTKYCSISCSRKAKGFMLSKADIEHYAISGAMVSHVCAQLDISPNTFTRALKRLDMYRMWQRARYAKCKVGSTQSTRRPESRIGTAKSARAGSTRSARSEERTATAMSCG